MKENKKESGSSLEKIAYLKLRNDFTDIFLELEKFTDEMNEMETKQTLISGENPNIRGLNPKETSASLIQDMGKTMRKINDLFNEIIDFSNNHNLYWVYCNEKIYKSKLNKFKSKLSPESGIEMIDILEEEINFYINKGKFKGGLYHVPFFKKSFICLDFQKYLYKENVFKIKALVRKHIDILTSEIENEGFELNVVAGEIQLTKMTKNDSSFHSIPIEDALTLKDLPEFDILDRFELLKELGIDSIIHNIDTPFQRSRYKVLALILGCHPENARKLISSTYPKQRTKEERITLRKLAKKNVASFFKNSINNIKIS